MRFQILYKDNEIFLHPKVNCNAIVCTCTLDNGLKCSYTAQEAQEEIAKYYEKRAAQVRHQSSADFILEFLVER